MTASCAFFTASSSVSPCAHSRGMPCLSSADTNQRFGSRAASARTSLIRGSSDTIAPQIVAGLSSPNTRRQAAKNFGGSAMLTWSVGSRPFVIFMLSCPAPAACGLARHCLPDRPFSLSSAIGFSLGRSLLPVTPHTLDAGAPDPITPSLHPSIQDALGKLDQSSVLALQPRCLRAVSDCRPRSVQLRRLRGAAYLPVLKRFEDGSVRFRYMTLHKFRYYSIALRDRFRPPVLLSHGQPSILKRGKFPFLLVGHWSLR